MTVQIDLKSVLWVNLLLTIFFPKSKIYYLFLGSSGKFGLYSKSCDFCTLDYIDKSIFPDFRLLTVLTKYVLAV